MWPTWRGLGVTVPDGAQTADRQDFITLLAAVVPEGMLTPINTITSLPDTEDADVLAFYNAGILTGVDDWGTFAGERTLTRAECAAMVARVARPELRQAFTPADYDIFTAAGMKPSDVLFTGGTTAGQFLPVVQELIDGLEADCAAAGMEFNWFNTVDGVEFLDYVTNTALARFGVSPRTTARSCTRTSTCRSTTPACWISGAHKGSPRACARAAVSPISSRRAAIHGGRPVEARPPAARPRGFPGRWMARRGRRAPRIGGSGEKRADDIRPYGHGGCRVPALENPHICYHFIK